MQNRSVKQSAIAFLAVAAMILCSASVILSDGSDAATIDKATVDAAGNELKSEYDSSAIVTVGVGALRWTAYFGKTADVVCIDAGDANNASWNGKAYRSLFSFDQAGLVSKMSGSSCTPSEADLAAYGMAAHDHNGFSTSNLEAIAQWENVPTLMIVSNSVYDGMSDELKKGITRLMDLVVIIEVDSFLVGNDLSDDFKANLSILAAVFDDVARADKLVSSIDYFVADIAKSVKGLDAKYEAAYIGSASQAGAKVLTWTVGSYCPFDLAGVNNSYTGSTSTVAVDGGSEIMSACNPDVIFADLSGTAQYSKEGSAGVLTYAEMKEVPVYALLPYFWFGLNFDNALADGYLLAYYAYGALGYSACLEKVEAVYEAFYPEMEDGSAALAGFESYYSNTGSKIFLGNEYGVKDGAITLVAEPTDDPVDPVDPVDPGFIGSLIKAIVEFILNIFAIIAKIFGF